MERVLIKKGIIVTVHHPGSEPITNMEVVSWEEGSKAVIGGVYLDELLVTLKYNDGNICPISFSHYYLKINKEEIKMIDLKLNDNTKKLLSYYKSPK